MKSRQVNHIIFFALSICFISFSFTNPYANNLVKTRSDCSFNFENDLKTNKIKLFLIGGIAPTHVQGQEQYEKKFNFQYYDYGCTPEAKECSKAYSAKAFKYLDQKFGRSWRKQVRQDVLYLRGKNHL